jgi:hypothetical protein
MNFTKTMLWVVKQITSEAFAQCTLKHKLTIIRYVRRYVKHDGFPVERLLALACIRMNTKHKTEIPQGFINWMYYL